MHTPQKPLNLIRGMCQNFENSGLKTGSHEAEDS
jgi:hypothetical protein